MNFSSYDDDIKTSLKDDFENLKNNFVKETVSNINIYFLYNVNQVCEQYKKIIMPVVEGQLTKDALYSEIIKNRNDSGRRFNVNGIYAYNFDVDELFDYIETDDQCFKVLHLSHPLIIFNTIILYLCFLQMKKAKIQDEQDNQLKRKL